MAEVRCMQWCPVRFSESISRLYGRVLRTHPDHLRIARAAGWLLLFSLAAKLVAAARELVIAWHYGRGPEVDAFNIALTLATWLPLTLFSVMNIVLLPTLVRLTGQERKVFLSELNGVGLVVGFGLSLAAWIMAPWLADWFAQGLPDATRLMGREMLQSIAPLGLLTVLIAIFATRLQALHDHRYSLAEGMPPLAIILFLLASHGSGPTPLVAGILFGTAFQVGWLAWLAYRHEPEVQGFAVRLKSPQWSPIWQSFLVMGAGQLLFSFAGPVDQYFAASLGPGAIATLGYANRLISIAVALGAVVIARATLPVFTEGVANGEHQRVRQHASKWALMMFAVGLVSAAAAWVVAPAIVGLLFERGAFTSADTAALATALRWGVWQLPFYLAGLVMVSALASERRYRMISIVAVAAVLAKLAVIQMLAERLEVSGVLLSTVTMYAVSMLCCWLAVTRLNSGPAGVSGAGTV